MTLDTSCVFGFVVVRTGSTVDGATLRQWCAATLAKFKVSSAIHLIEAMPTTSGTNGTKIKAATLRGWAAEWAQRAASADSNEK